MRGENAPPREGWVPQPGRHCGEFCWDIACSVCGEYLPAPANVVLSDN